ncbi:MAG: sugar transferase, partial [Candidatus Omnitrophica bacterium]|nr:sugar transferase [Candidatus Omnitrophota bacterium]
RVGRFLRTTALDELPQLINILKGEMSFVGPRALRPLEKEVESGFLKNVSEYQGFQERCRVTPGLTGVAQVFSARTIGRQRKFLYDLWYVRNHTFALDVFLVFISFLVSLRGRWEEKSGKFTILGKALQRKIEQEIS